MSCQPLNGLAQIAWRNRCPLADVLKRTSIVKSKRWPPRSSCTCWWQLLKPPEKQHWSVRQRLISAAIVTAKPWQFTSDCSVPPRLSSSSGIPSSDPPSTRVQMPPIEGESTVPLQIPLTEERIRTGGPNILPRSPLAVTNNSPKTLKQAQRARAIGAGSQLSQPC